MEGLEYRNEQETEQAVERVRTPIDGQFELVVTTELPPENTHQEEGVLDQEEDDSESFEEVHGEMCGIMIRDSYNGEIVVNLASLAEQPSNKPEVSFMTEYDFAADPTKRMVKFPEASLSDPKEIFAILHEMGHIIRHDKMNNEQSSFLEEVQRKLWESKEVTTKEVQMVVQDERDAWAEAIKLARRLKSKHGVDLFKLFKSADEFMGWLRATGLRSYEGLLGAESHTKDAKVKMWEESVNGLAPSDDFNETEKAVYQPQGNF